MSKAKALEFFNQAAENPALQKRLQQAQAPADFLNIAREQGYSLTLEDLNAATLAIESEQFEDKELDPVAGGRLLDKLGKGFSNLFS